MGADVTDRTGKARVSTAGRANLFLEEQIETSRVHIDRWVEANAAASTPRPRYRGAGVVVPGQLSCMPCRRLGDPCGTGDYLACQGNGKTG